MPDRPALTYKQKMMLIRTRQQLAGLGIHAAEEITPMRIARALLVRNHNGHPVLHTPGAEYILNALEHSHRASLEALFAAPLPKVTTEPEEPPPTAPDLPPVPSPGYFPAPLGERQREALRLRYGPDGREVRSFTQIAQAMGTNRHRVQDSIAHALNLLWLQMFHLNRMTRQGQNVDPELLVDLHAFDHILHSRTLDGPEWLDETAGDLSQPA